MDVGLRSTAVHHPWLARIGLVLLVTCAGIAIGDVEALRAHRFADLFSAVMLSPFTVTTQGACVHVPGVDPRWFVAGGLAFWPVFGLLGWWMSRRPTLLAGLLLFLWCAQGFCQVTNRLYCLMSV